MKRTSIFLLVVSWRVELKFLFCEKKESDKTFHYSKATVKNVYKNDYCKWIFKVMSSFCHCVCPFKLPYSELIILPSISLSKMAKLEELEELDISGNKLKAIPTTILNCRRMHTVIAHSNCIEVFPEVMQLPEVKVCGWLWTPGFKSAKNWLPKRCGAVL